MLTFIFHYNASDKNMFQKISKFIVEVKLEMAKVSWPTREELRSSTLIVLMVSSIFAIFIYLVDRILSSVLSVIY